MVSLFASYIIIDFTKTNPLAFFSVFMLIMGIVFLFFVNRKYKKTLETEYVLQKGYEKYLFFGTYIVIFVVDILIIMGIYTSFSVASPLLMLCWLLPMICYSFYQSMWLCFHNEIHIMLQRDIQKLPYQKIRKIEIQEIKKNKYTLVLTTKKETYSYQAKKEILIQMKEFVAQKVPI